MYTASLIGFIGAPLVPLAMTLLLGKQGTTRRIPVAAGLLFFLAPAFGPPWAACSSPPAAGRGSSWSTCRSVWPACSACGASPPPAPARDPRARFDPIGLALLSAGLTLAQYGASRATITRWDALSSVVAFAAVFLLPVFTQAVQHNTALATGLALLPQGVITGLGIALGQRLATRITVRILVTVGFVVLAATSAGLLLLTTTTPLWVTATILSGRAIAIGFGITPLLFAMLEPLTDTQLTDGNAVFNIAQRLGGSLGVNLLASLFAARTPVAGPVTSFHEIGLILTALALAAAALSLKLAPIRQSPPT